MLTLFVIAVAVQGGAMLVDEVAFHYRRELPRWERIGHPLDTLTIAACLAFLLVAPPGSAALGGYVALAAGSTLFVTKDEFVHARLCSGGEHWLHALLFVVHPIVLFAFGVLWWSGTTTPLAVQLAVTVAFGAYQLVYWNFPRRREIDNAWYADLGARWYTADDTPIALLRAESRHRNPWIAEQLGPLPRRVLDLGCGAGFLANYLAARGHAVTGVDTTVENLVVAQRYDDSGRVAYQVGDACALALPDETFDAVCAMDLLEHVERPEQLIAEASRVLVPGGIFVFHTFNRTWLANLIVIKGVAWFVNNAPPDLHVLHLFRTPEEVQRMLAASDLELALLRGSRPRVRWPLLRMLLTGRVGDDFAFTFTRSTQLGYTGVARKRQRLRASIRVTPATRGSDSGERPSLPPSP